MNSPSQRNGQDFFMAQQAEDDGKSTLDNNEARVCGQGVDRGMAFPRASSIREA
jgi:hypothetical protein